MILVRNVELLSKLDIMILMFNEPYDSCIVKQGVSSGLIGIDRYESYLKIMCDVLGVKDYLKILNSVKSRSNNQN